MQLKKPVVQRIPETVKTSTRWFSFPNTAQPAPEPTISSNVHGTKSTKPKNRPFPEVAEVQSNTGRGRSDTSTSDQGSVLTETLALHIQSTTMGRLHTLHHLMTCLQNTQKVKRTELHKSMDLFIIGLIHLKMTNPREYENASPKRDSETGKPLQNICLYNSPQSKLLSTMDSRRASKQSWPANCL